MNKPKIDNADFARIVGMTEEEGKQFREGFGQYHSVEVVVLNGWQPIETAPKDGTVIIGWHEVWHKQPLAAVWYQGTHDLKGGWYVAADGSPAIESQGDWGTEYMQTHISHWQPMPTTDTIST